MPVEKAVQAFKERRFNCAQSVLHGFQKQMDVPEQIIAEAKAFGGGRAEAQRCGALHAALFLAKEPAMGESICREFAEKAGSEKCREIRKAKLFSCEQCVELAAELLAKSTNSDA